MIFLIERKKERDKNNMVNISTKKPIQSRLKLFKQISNLLFFAKKYSTSITIGYWNKLITFRKMPLNCRLQPQNVLTQPWIGEKVLSQ